jgi:hypothetical protein
MREQNKQHNESTRRKSLRVLPPKSLMMCGNGLHIAQSLEYIYT